jgi:hypothetical protein
VSLVVVAITEEKQVMPGLVECLQRTEGDPGCKKGLRVVGVSVPVKIRSGPHVPGPLPRPAEVLNIEPDP